MKKLRLTGAAAALATAASIGSCGIYGPPQNTNPDVYGPPEYYESLNDTSAAETTFETSLSGSDQDITLYASDATLYGPPSAFEVHLNTTSSSETTTTAAETTIKASAGVTTTTATTTTPAETTTAKTTTTAAATTSKTTTTASTTTTKATSQTTISTTDTEESETEATEPKSFFSVDDNVGEDVYGPPEWFDLDPDNDDDPIDDFDPDMNDAETVYGPPEWFE